jgi:hypothetical protein
MLRWKLNDFARYVFKPESAAAALNAVVFANMPAMLCLARNISFKSNMR